MRTPYDPKLHDQTPRVRKTYDEDDQPLIGQWDHWVRETLLGRVIPCPATKQFNNPESTRQWTQRAVIAIVATVKSTEFIQVTKDNRAGWQDLFQKVWLQMPAIYSPEKLFKGQQQPWLLSVLQNVGGATYGNPSLAAFLEVVLKETTAQRQRENLIYRDNTNPMALTEFDVHEQIGKAILDLWVESLLEDTIELTGDALNDWTGVVNTWREQYNEPGNRLDYLLKHAVMMRQLLANPEQQAKISPMEKQLQKYCQTLPELPVMRTKEMAKTNGRAQAREWYATTEIIFASYLAGHFPELIDTRDKKLLIEKITRERAQGGVSLLPVMNKMLNQMEKTHPDDDNYLWWRKIGLEAALEQEKTVERVKPMNKRL